MASGKSGKKDELLDILRAVIKQVRDNSGLTRDELLSLYDDGQVMLPIGIFLSDLGPLEAVVRFLKEENNLPYSEIARILNRDDKAIWATYHAAIAKKTKAANFDPKKEQHFIPASIFAQRNLSVLEHVVVHLKDTLKMPVKTICKITNRMPGTIWATYHNAHLKLKK